MQLNIKKIKLDSIAIGLSFLCAVHCLLTPILTLTLPFLGTGSPLEEVLHGMVLFVAIPIGGISLYIGYKKHRCNHTLILGIIGIAFLLPHVFKLRTLIGTHPETALTTIGSIILAIALYRNNLKAKHCIVPTCHDHTH